MRILRSLLRTAALSAVAVAAVAAVFHVSAKLPPSVALLVSLLSMGAILEGGILGKGRNAIGGMVLTTWKGIQVARARVTPANPQTIKQQAARGVFGEIASSLKYWVDLTARPLVDSYVSKQSGYSRLVQVSRLAMGNTFERIRLAVSDGPLPAPVLDTTDVEAGGDEITFAGTAPGDPNGADVIHAQAVDAETGALRGTEITAPRGAATLTVPNGPAIMNGSQILYVWASGTRNGDLVQGSPSVALANLDGGTEVSKVVAGESHGSVSS